MGPTFKSLSLEDFEAKAINGDGFIYQKDFAAVERTPNSFNKHDTSDQDNLPDLQ